MPITLRDLQAHRATLMRHWKLIALLGLTGIAAFQTLGYVALATTTALNTILLLALACFWPYSPDNPRVLRLRWT